MFVFNSYAISPPSDSVKIDQACVADAFLELNGPGGQPPAAGALLQRWCIVFVFALDCCLLVMTSGCASGLNGSASSALRASSDAVVSNDPAVSQSMSSSAVTYPATDTFSGSGALSSNWTKTTSNLGYVSLTQNSGTVVPSVSGKQGLEIYTGVSFANNQYAQAQFVTHPSAYGSTGVCVRMNTAGSGVCYLAAYGEIYSLTGGAGKYAIARDCPVARSEDTIQLLVVGTTYTCTDLTTGHSASATDSLYSTGNPGILVDQRRSTAYELARFKADCSPSCGGGGSSTNPQLTISPPSLSFGSVTVNTATTQSITLSSTGGSPVKVSASAITGPAFTIVNDSLPVILNPTQRIALQIRFEPTTTGTATGRLTIGSNSASSSTAAVALTGTGTNSTSMNGVALAWDASTSSPSLVAGYNIYRSISGGSLQLMNSSPDMQTTYMDSSVMVGTTYNYVVKTVGSNGVESAPSNQITVIVP
jgi:hypothetical protein